jgi:hypothetical protein
VRKIALAILLFLPLCLSTLAVLLCLWPLIHRLSERPMLSAPTLEQIRTLSVLTTLRVEVAQVCEVSINGYTGGMSAVLVVHGQATIGVDLTRARMTSIDPVARRVTLQLPRPTGLTAALDHDRTHLVSLQPSGLWILIPDSGGAAAQLTERCYRRGAEVVARVTDNPSLIERAQTQAELQLKKYVTAMGWTVELVWI